MNAKTLLTCAVLALLASFALPPLQAQQRQPRRWDPEQMRQRMMDRMKERLGVEDAEWKVIQPRLEKVMTLSREAGSRGNMMFGRRGRRGRDRDNEEPTTATGKATEKLRELLENENATPEQIKTALTELRNAREKTRQELDKARQELLELITVKQEAQLVMMGVLE